MAGLRTEFSFTLPKGYVGDDGILHRDGTMRLATARDEIEPLRDRSIDGPDDPYLTVLVLARVITRLGSIEAINTDVVEGLFAADLAFLQDLYGIINFGDPADVAALQDSVLPAETSDDNFDDERGIDAFDGGDTDDDTESTNEVVSGELVDTAAESLDEEQPQRGRGSGRVEEVAQ
ncbi:MAG: hypothetical protein ACI9N0_000858 [Ilumatobacter sp.]|jgi:hypothetical protein